MTGRWHSAHLRSNGAGTHQRLRKVLAFNGRTQRGGASALRLPRRRPKAAWRRQLLVEPRLTPTTLEKADQNGTGERLLMTCACAKTGGTPPARSRRTAQTVASTAESIGPMSLW